AGKAGKATEATTLSKRGVADPSFYLARYSLVVVCSSVRAVDHRGSLLSPIVASSRQVPKRSAFKVGNGSRQKTADWEGARSTHRLIRHPLNWLVHSLNRNN